MRSVGMLVFYEPCLVYVHQLNWWRRLKLFLIPDAQYNHYELGLMYRLRRGRLLSRRDEIFAELIKGTVCTK